MRARVRGLTKWTPDYDDRVRIACRKLREQGDYRLADMVGQMDLLPKPLPRREPEQLTLPFPAFAQGVGGEPQ